MINRFVFRIFSGVLILALQITAASAAEAQTYEAPLPARISTDPDL
jgi:hypothetical protein